MVLTTSWSHALGPWEMYIAWVFLASTTKYYSKAFWRSVVFTTSRKLACEDETLWGSLRIATAVANTSYTTSRGGGHEVRQVLRSLDIWIGPLPLALSLSPCLGLYFPHPYPSCPTKLRVVTNTSNLNSWLYLSNSRTQ